MSSILAVLAIIGVVVVTLALIFVIQAVITPRLLAGTLSEPTLQPCIGGRQWALYDCKPNSYTRFGCIVPNSGGQLITFKTVAIQNSHCQAQSNGDTPGDRVISFQWQVSTTTGPTPCESAGTTCCVYNQNCTKTVTYNCVRTPAPLGGENQCTPQYLPAPFPGFKPGTDYTIVPAVIQVPCRENYCG